jgi:uncharacterized protein YbaR (Trm112 family)
MRTLFDILACPACKGALVRHEDHLACPACAVSYPVIKGVPVFLPGVVPEFEADLPVRPGYSMWKERLLYKALGRGQVALDFGCGHQSLDDPNIVRMDACLHPYVDVVGDVHNLPFRDDVLHIASGSAVFEHLKEPRKAAAELWRVLAPGGFLYADWNFVFAYHGFPAHYFNASIDGQRAVFERFRIIEEGVAPFQGPGSALRQVLTTYLDLFKPADDEARSLQELLKSLLLRPLEEHDRNIPAADRHRVAAGVFVLAVKDLSGQDSILPPAALARWANDKELQRRFPEPRNIAQASNLLQWVEENTPRAEQDSAEREVADLFSKDGSGRPRHEAIAAWPWALLTAPENDAAAEVRRVLLARQRPLSEKVSGLLRRPSDVLKLPQRAARYALWRMLHLIGRAP